MDGLKLRVAQIVPETDAEGPGRRFALWFQGCVFRCPGCCNPEFLRFEGGDLLPLADVVDLVRDALQRWGVEGVTLLGGEPLAHAEGAAALAKAVRHMGLSVMVFTGYTLEEARDLPDPAVAELLSLTDLLVDGRYEADKPDSRRRWIGSTNQRIHCLTDRYSADDPCWSKRNTLEIRVSGGEVSVNGFPAAAISPFWRRKPKPIESGANP